MEKIKQGMISGQLSSNITWDDVKDLVNTLGVIFTVLFNTYLEYSGLSQKALTMLVVLLVCDSAAGLLKSHVIKSYSRDKLYHGFIKKFILLVIPIVLKALMSFSEVEGGVLFNVYCVVIALHEAESFFGSIYTIRTKKTLPERDIISTMAKFMYQFLDNALKRVLKSTQDENKENTTDEK